MAQKNKSLNINSLLFAIFVFIALIAAFLVVNNYYTQLSIFEDKELARLKGIASTLSIQIDGDEHQSLIEKYGPKDAIMTNRQDEAYFKMHLALKNAKEKNELETTIYTMVFDSSMNKFCFGVSSSEPFWKHAYRDFPEELFTQYSAGGVIPPYQDSNGYWLSAFEPILDKSKRTVGIVQVDAPFDAYIMQTRSAIWMNVCISLAVLGTIGALMFLFLRSALIHQEKLKSEREQVEKFRQDLIANVSHDLRTPIATIQGYLETILMKKDKIEREQLFGYLSTTLSNTKKLGALVNELFELSKLESKERKLNLEYLNVGELVQDVIRSLSIKGEAKGVTINSNISKDIHQIQVDIELIDRVLKNLIDNSIKFCEKDDSILVTVTEDADYLKVKICDTGRGIAPEEMPVVFERFQKTQQSNGQGTGLGLAIVKNVLELHGARYHISSELGKGTEFFFELPRR